MIIRFLFITIGIICGASPTALSQGNPLKEAIEHLQNNETETAYAQFLDLSKKGLAPADYWIATMHLKGLGVQKDVPHAISWLHRAARQNYAPAMLVLGDIHLKGLDGRVREGLALGWFNKAAEIGDAFALMQVGKMYTEGRGVKRNPVIGMKYVRRAAELNSPQAQHILGLAYVRGIGVTPDTDQARYWFEQALINGFEAARPDYEALGP